MTDPDEVGSSFYFRLNNFDLFLKGGNYIPPDMFMPRVTTSVYEKIIADALAVNYNVIRVWGGGNFENDEFYDLCDRKGIFVW